MLQSLYLLLIMLHAFYFNTNYAIMTTIITIINENNMNTANPSAIDQNVFNALRDSMGDVFEDILTVFLDETENLVSRIKEQLENDDLVGVSMTAHTLKSSTRTLGANRLSDICAEIEGASTGNKKEINLLYVSLVLEKHATTESIKNILA